MEKNIKLKLIKKYIRREPTRFQQHDGFANLEPGDFIMSPDEDGDCCLSSETWELMYGADVRILIKEGTTYLDAIRLLKKIVKYIERDKESFNQ